MKRYDRDKTILLKHSPVQLSAAQALNQVGAGGYLAITEAPVDYDDDNALFVDKTGNDSTGDGTTANPYLTIQKAVTETDEDHGYVIVQDSDDYIEGALTVGTYFLGLYAATGETPRISLREYDNSYSPTDSNTIYISATDGNDTTGDGTAALPVATITKAITLCDATHQNMLIVDSETYEEVAFELSGNALNLRAAIGETPVVDLQINSSFFSVSKNTSQTAVPNIDVGANTFMYIEDAVLDNNNNIVLHMYNGHASGDKDSYYTVQNDLFSTIKAETALGTGSGAIQAVAGCVLPSGNYLQLYYRYVSAGDMHTYGQIVNCDDYSIVLAETEVYDYAPGGMECLTLPDGNVLMTWHDARDSYAKFKVLSSANLTEVKAEQNISNSYYYVFPVLTGNNDEIAFVSQRRADNYLMYELYDIDTWTSKGAASVINSSASNYPIVIKLDNDYMLILYFDSADEITCKIYDDTWTLFATESGIAETTYIGPHAACKLQNGDIYHTYRYSSACYYQVYRLSAHHLNVVDSGIVGGVSITTGVHAYLNQLIKTDSAELEVHHCTIEDGTSSVECCDCAAIGGDDNVEMYNSIIRDCDKGLDLESNTAIVKNSQMYRITEGAAICVDGAAASSEDILVDHCDIFNCWRGVELQNNNGNEVIKNSILHENANGHFCETEATIKDSICTDNVDTSVEDDDDNASAGFDTSDDVTTSNPMYVNEGAISEDDTDLHLKARSIGYAVNSPGLESAGDSKNAGSYDVKYSLISETWEELTLPKGQVDVRNIPVGAASCTRRDGSMSASQNARQEQITLSWATLLLSYYEGLLELLNSDSSRILQYPDPESAPLDYDEYTMVYGEVNGGSPVYVQSQDGVNDNTLVLARAYEEDA